MMNITEPFLPPIESYVKQLARIWKTKYLTNNGPVLRQLETGVEEYLNASNISFAGNGKIGFKLP